MGRAGFIRKYRSRKSGARSNNRNAQADKVTKKGPGSDAVIATTAT